MKLCEIFEQDDFVSHSDHLEKTGFWGRRGAGCIFLSASTGRLLFALRSKYVQEPRTWGTWGGAIDQGESPIEAVKREAYEETLNSNIQIMDVIPLYVFDVPNVFTYYNFLVVVPDEFTPDIHSVENWETEGYKWVPFGKWPTPLHPGSVKLLNDSNSVHKIKQAIVKYYS